MKLVEIAPEGQFGIKEIIVIGVSVGGIVGVISVIIIQKKKSKTRKKDKKAKFIPEDYSY